MEPNKPQDAPVEPTTGQPPVTPAAPVTTPAPSPSPAPVQPTAAPAAAVTSPPHQKESKAILFILLAVGAVVALVVAAVVAWLFYLSPAAQTKRTSNAFMKALTSKDMNKVFELAGTSDESVKSFLTSAADSSSGSFTFKQGTLKDGKGYFLYDLTNNKGKMGRTTVEKQNGKYYVSNYVFGSDNLALIPGSSTSTPAASSDSPAPAQAAACLVDGDVAKLTDGTAYGTTSADGTSRRYVVDSFFFEPDKTTFSFVDVTNRQLNEIKTFYDANKSKEFQFHLKGSVYEGSATASGEKLAHDRAEKIKAELVSRGVAADRFVEETPTRSNHYGDGSERNVDLSIRVSLPCTSSNNR